MVPNSAPDPNATSPARASVGELKPLLARLYADPPSPDLITIDDILRRYHLTGLGAPAMAAIEQTQRLIRTRRDYGQIGLCEFHIGLIYLHFNDPRAAALQFAAARQSWTLAGDAAAIALSHYAQGVALRLAYHYEPAMSHFGRAERALRRSQIGAQAQRLAELGVVLEPTLRRRQETLREEMWPVDAPVDRPVNRAMGNTAAGNTAVDEPVAGQTAATASAAPGPDGPPAAAAVPGPISRLPKSSPPPPTPPAAGSPRYTPLPGHQALDGRYQWYTVHKRKDAYLPDFVEGTWVLVDSEPSLVVDDHELVIVASRQAEMGSVIVRPRTAQYDMPFYYLGYRLPVPSGLPPDMAVTLQRSMPLVLDEEGLATTISDAMFLGVVVGAWHAILG